jgi:predicted alpha/beta-hydrolase family hydrolase
MREIHFFDHDKTIYGHLINPQEPQAWVVFAHGSGSSRKSSRNNFVAGELAKRGIGCLLFDLLTEEEDKIYSNRFDIELLAQRLLLATGWLKNSEFYKSVPIAFFGASTGSACALLAAIKIQDTIPLYTVISRGGRPDLAGEETLKKVNIPVLLIVGSKDEEVMQLNEKASESLKNYQLVSIPGAHHLFEEPGALEKVTGIVGDWLLKHIPIS